MKPIDFDVPIHPFVEYNVRSGDYFTTGVNCGRFECGELIFIGIERSQWPCAGMLISAVEAQL